MVVVGGGGVHVHPMAKARGDVVLSVGMLRGSRPFLWFGSWEGGKEGRREGEKEGRGEPPE